MNTKLCLKFQNQKLLLNLIFLGISILAKKPGNAPPSFFSFADPFALDTWIMLALAYAVVSVSLFILGRICHDEWTNPYPCVEEPEFLINQFSLANSFWFTVGALMQQGTEIAPMYISLFEFSFYLI